MKPVITIVPTTEAHIRVLCQTLRNEDKLEIESYGVSTSYALWDCFKNGKNNKTALVDGMIAAAWGAGSDKDGIVGKPWLITNYQAKRVSSLRFARVYISQVAEMMKTYQRLENYCDSSYNGAIRLLKICGFTVGDPEPYGKGIFRKFSMEAK